MKTLKLGLVVVMAWLGLAMAPARAWNHTGHMVVAQIAYGRLTPAARLRAEQLVALGAEPENRTFVTAACWPDDLKSYGITLYSPLHYIDTPFSSDGTALPAAAPSPNVETTMAQCVKVLLNRRAPEIEKARMLRFLLHFVGDVHQPLHCVSRYSAQHPQGDRGGGDFLIKGLPERNLHGLWDAGAGLFATYARPLNADDASAVTRLAAACAAAYPADRVPEWQDGNFQTWIGESVALAKRVVYANVDEGGTPSAAYQTLATESVRKRVALAGYRLADLLNRTLADAPVADPGPPASTAPAATSATSTPTLTELANNTTVRVAVGATVMIRLASNRTTGYGWRIARHTSKKLTAVGEPVYEQAAANLRLVGAGGHEVFTFHALAAGQSTVELRYERPWEPDVAPAKTFRVKVVISPSA